ncbi:MAG: hypothetical protein ACPGXK_15370, partial [Phycisphaerae bacterium]
SAEVPTPVAAANEPVSSVLPSSTDPNDPLAAMQQSAATLGKIADARLIGWGAVDPIQCTVQEVGEGGIQVMASTPGSLTVGSRVEIVIEPSGDAHGLGDLLGEGCYATVIRTERANIPGTEDAGMSAGLRFDQPLML